MEASRPSEVLARQVRRWRDERKLSAQALANRLAEMGSDLTRRAISKIENGDRGVSVDEWLQLAHALAVPPPLLVLDLESGADVAIAPRVALHPWIVWEWIVGEVASPVPAPGGGAFVSRVEEFGRARTAIYLYRREKAAASAVHSAQTRIGEAEFTGDEEQQRSARAAYVEALRELARALDAMVEHGMTPPDKPRDWIETIRELGLSQYPDSLVMVDRRSDGGQR